MRKRMLHEGSTSARRWRTSATAARLASMLVALAFAAAGLPGCAAPDDGDDSNPATVSGFISNQSTARPPRPPRTAPRPPRTMFASLFDSLGLVSVAHAGRSGVLVTIPGVDGAEAVSDAFGFFVVESGESGSRTVSFDIGGAVFARNVLALRAGTVMLAGVSFESDGSASSAASLFAASGLIQGANCGVSPRTLTLETPDVVTVSLTNDAEIFTAEGITCEALNESIGDRVFVHGDEQSLAASWVTESGFSPTGLTQFSGRVTSTNCGVSLDVTRSDGESILVNVTNTAYRGGLDSCDDVTVGQDLNIIGEPRTAEIAASWIFP